MKNKVLRILQLLLGLFMVVIGFNKFLEFTEIPNPVGDGGTLMGIYISSKFLKLIGVLEVISGLGLVVNKFVPLGLTFITAIMFNATVFHILHDPVGVGPALLSLLLSLLLVYRHKSRFSDLLRI